MTGNKRFIKLTLLDTSPIYLDHQHIISIQKGSGNITLVGFGLMNSQTVSVTETPEDVIKAVYDAGLFKITTR